MSWKVQPGRRLVEDVQRRARAALREFLGELDRVVLRRLKASSRSGPSEYTSGRQRISVSSFLRSAGTLRKNS